MMVSTSDYTSHNYPVLLNSNVTFLNSSQTSLSVGSQNTSQSLSSFAIKCNNESISTLVPIRIDDRCPSENECNFNVESNIADVSVSSQALSASSSSSSMYSMKNFGLVNMKAYNFDNGDHEMKE